MKILKTLLILLLVAFSISAEKLTKEKIEKMVNAKVEKSLIISLIKSDCVDFKLTTDLLIEWNNKINKDIVSAISECLNKNNSKVQAKEVKEKDDIMDSFVKVEEGEFVMGNNRDKYAKPEHKVYLDTYWISKHEVRLGDFKKFVNETGYTTEIEKKGYVKNKNFNNPSFSQTDEHPVVLITLKDAMQYCKWLSEKTKQDISLPTEAQWEKAAKGGNKSKGYTYSGSNNINIVAWYSDNADSKTHPVCQKKPNELGIYDMSGNVREWCLDRYKKKYYKTSPKKNPQGPLKGRYRILRGGGWSFKNKLSFTTTRRGFHYGSWRGCANFTGFRIVKND